VDDAIQLIREAKWNESTILRRCEVYRMREEEGIPVNDIAAKFKITPRMIYKDMKAITELLAVLELPRLLLIRRTVAGRFERLYWKALREVEEAYDPEIKLEAIRTAASVLRDICDVYDLGKNVNVNLTTSDADSPFVQLLRARANGSAPKRLGSGSGGHDEDATADEGDGSEAGADPSGASESLD